VNLQSNDFELFGLPQQFAQDRAAIDLRWKELQREAHPDKFAAQGAAAQRVAMQWSVRINEAYQRLKDPLRRAAYLCELSGVR
jgi:molecular chaperone HscB